MLRMTNLFRLCCVFAIAAAGSLSRADDSPATGTRILFLTYSGGYPHGSVTRKGQPLAPAERAMTNLGISSNLFRTSIARRTRPPRSIRPTCRTTRS